MTFIDYTCPVCGASTVSVGRDASSRAVVNEFITAHRTAHLAEAALWNIPTTVSNLHELAADLLTAALQAGKQGHRFEAATYTNAAAHTARAAFLIEHLSTTKES